MIIHSPIISGSLTFADGATFALPDGGIYSGSFSGSLQVHEITSNLIPDASASYDLGSEAFPFRELYLSGNSAILGGIKIGAGPGGLNFKKNSDDSPAEVAVSAITIGGALGTVGSKKFKLNDNNKIEVRDENDDIDSIEVKEIILKDTSGNGKNTVVKNDGGRFTTQEVNDSGTVTSVDSEGSLSGSFTGSVLDLTATGDATFNDAVTVSGLSSLDGGIDVDGAFTVADGSGNVSTTGTLAAGNTNITGTIDASGLSSLDGGIDVDGAFTVADGSGNVSTTGTLNADGNATLGGTLGVTGNTTLSGTLGVTGNTTLSGTLSAGATTISGLTIGATEVTSTAAELNILDGVTATATEINALDGITVDATKLNYLSDMTGNVKNYIDTEVAGVVNSAPATLDTLNELAAALGDDPNFATTISTQIGGKVSQSLQVIAGNGLTGGGTLTEDRTLNVVGTSARISVTADAIDIDSGYVGQTSITTLGTIGTGVWAGTDVAIAHGGTGASTAAGALTNLGLTATAAELNKLDGVTTTTTELNHVSGVTSAIQTQLDDKISLTALSATDAGGDGSFSYNNTTGVFTYTGPSAADVRAHFSGGTGVTITDGSIAIGQAVATNSSVTFATVSATGDIVAYASSDERLKDNIEVISNPIEKVQQLKGVTWDWNDNADELQKSLPNVGVIAQDVEKVLPQLVKDRDNGFKGVDYDKIVGLLIEAIKDQQSQIDELKSQLK